MPDLPVPNNSGDNLTTTFRHIEAYLYYLAQFGGGGGGGSGNVSTAVVLDANNIILGNGGTSIKDTAAGTGVVAALGQNVTGSGGIVLATSPTLVTPALGIPASGLLTNCTGLPINTGLVLSGQAHGDILFFNGTNWTNLPAGVDGQFLQTKGNASDPQWVNAGSGSPAGANTQVQYNNSGAFGADAGLTYASGVLSLGQNGIQAGQMVIFASGGASGSLQLHSNAGGDVTWFANATGNISLSNPDTSGTIVLENNTATLTNKTISGSDNTINNVSLTTGVTGTLPLANGGTGQTSAQAAINALMAASGALSQGDVFYFNGTNVVRLAAGTNGHFLQTQGAGANLQWAAGGGGSTPTGGTLNRSVATSSTSASSSTQIPTDNTIPQNTEGVEYLTVSITPTSATSKLRITFSSWMSNSGLGSSTVALFQDSTANALSSYYTTQGAADYGTAVNMIYEMTAGTTSATTFKIRFGPNNGNTAYMLRNASGDLYSTAKQSVLEVMELKE